jgi:hypothetical protein
VAQERYRALLCMKNLPAIETWRAGLDEAQRRRLNHPGAVWAHWRRSLKADQPSLHRQHVVSGTKPHRTCRPIYWPQDAIRRAATALRECRSNDIFTLARIALEAALRCESDLIDLLPSDAAAMSALTPDERTSSARLVMSVKCHFRTHPARTANSITDRSSHERARLICAWIPIGMRPL